MDIKKSQKKSWWLDKSIELDILILWLIWQFNWRGWWRKIIVREYGEQSKRKEDKNLDLSEELSDVLFVVFCIANQTNIDLQSEFERKLIKKSIRDLSRHKENKKLF